MQPYLLSERFGAKMEHVLFLVDVVRPNDLIRCRYLVRVPIDIPLYEMAQVAREEVTLALANHPEHFDAGIDWLTAEPLEWDFHPRVTRVW
jgi:hypothetical protein